MIFFAMRVIGNEQFFRVGLGIIIMEKNRSHFAIAICLIRTLFRLIIRRG